VPWPVYSERFLSSPTGEGWSGVAVPGGRRAVVREVAVINTGMISGTVNVFAGPSQIFRRIFLASEPMAIYELRTVAYAGENLQVQRVGLGFAVTLSGYLFGTTVSASDPLPQYEAETQEELLELLSAPTPLPAAPGERWAPPAAGILR